MLVLIFNLPQSKVSWEEFPNKGLSRANWPMDMSVGMVLASLIDVGRPSLVRVIPFPGFWSWTI